MADGAEEEPSRGWPSQMLLGRLFLFWGSRCSWCCKFVQVVRGAVREYSLGFLLDRPSFSHTQTSTVRSRTIVRDKPLSTEGHGGWLDEEADFRNDDLIGRSMIG